VVDGVVDDVLERVRVLLLGFDYLRAEAAAEDVVPPTVALVEGAGVPAVEVAHPVREVRLGRLDEQVVVVAHQAAHVRAPPVATFDAAQDVDEEDAVVVLEEDRCEVIPAGGYVVLSPGGEIAAWAAHLQRR
jgi:hypothetical protein